MEKIIEKLCWFPSPFLWKWFWKSVLFLFLIYLPNKIISQNFTNRGKDFWVGHMGHIDGAASSFKLYITSTVNTSGIVSVPLQGWSVPYTITANTITIVQVPSSTGYVGCSDCIEGRGIHITANDNVAAYAHIYHSARSDATLLLPTPILGKEYYATCFIQLTSGQRSQFMVIATEDSTKVEITPSANTLGGNLANVPFIVTLQQGEVYQVQSATDLTGSKILSISNNNNICKRIAVFGGSTFTELGCVGSGDNLFEQMYPPNTWGKNFVTSPLKTRSGDIYRVMALLNGTTVSINGVPHLLNQLQYFDTLLSVPSYYTSDKPIVLSQYSRTEACDGAAAGDPFMIILSPIEQTVNNVLLYSSPEQSITGEYINITMKTADVGTFLLDGAAVIFNPIPAKPDYSYSQNTVSPGTHTLVADSGFNAIAYGFGSVESYGYLAGANAKSLPQINIAANPLPACKGSTINFNGSSSATPDSWKWNFGDSTTDTTQNTTHVYADTGTYIVSLVTTSPNGCDSEQDSTSYILHINGTSQANFNPPTICLSDTMKLLDISAIPDGGTINSWSWDLGDGNNSSLQNAKHLYSICDTFRVKLVIRMDNGCKDSTTKTVTVNCSPTANFSASSVCQNDATVFSDSSTGNISARNWNFGDGSAINTGNSPSYTYANSGIYNVTLTVISVFGCKDSITKPVQVYYNPVAGFTSSNVCFGDTMHFTNISSVDNSTSINSYLWAFGDSSSTSSIQNSNHFYSLAGTYNVTLVTKTIDGCSNAVAIPVKVFDAPVNSFSFGNTCLLDSAVFTNTSVNPTMGSVANWSWDFGDGTPLNTIAWNPNHLYAVPGNYSLTLITHSSNLGCPDTLKDTVTVFPMPHSNFNFTDVCLNQAMSFFDSSTIASGSIIGWSWYFGDIPPFVNLQDPIHVYANPGTFAVSLITTTNNGCKDSTTKSAVVHPLPVVEFSSLNVCDGGIVPFTNLSSILSTDSIQSWSWNFGDGSPVYTTQNASHLYADKGSYSVQLKIVSDFGCIDSINKISVVNPNPVVDFGADDTIGCEPLCISFQNLSSIASGNNVSFSWSFGDGSPIMNTQDLFYCYANDSVYSPVLYTPTLTVTSDSGCVSVLSKNNYITVYPKPDAIFTVQPKATSIVDPLISIKDLTIGGNYWNWNFGDLDTSSVFSPPPHTYADTGTYTIRLIALTQYNCIDTAYETISIEPDFLFYIPSAFSPNDDGVNDSFSGKGVFISNYEMSIFDRWGNLIFFTDDINKPWDGKANHGNDIAQLDVYVYVIKVIDFKNKKHSYKGVVTLTR